jgi:hypothetical protein
MSAFRSYFVKKLQNICIITFHSIAFLEKPPILGKFSKIITFSEEITTKLPQFHDFNQIFLIAFFNIKNCYNTKNVLI